MIRWRDGSTEYEGAVLDLRERNWHDDSDFYAVVWDGTGIREIEYDTTRFAGGGSAKRDATPEVRELAAAWNEENVIYPALVEAARMDAKRIMIGKVVVVVKGRNVPVGTTGTVIWIGDATYNYRTVTRIGISPSGTKVDGRYPDVIWTYDHNVAVLDPDAYMVPEDELREKAHRYRTDYTFASRMTSARMHMMVV